MYFNRVIGEKDNMKLKYKDIFLGFLGIVIIASEEFLYLIDNEETLIGVLSPKDIVLVLAVVWGIWIMVRYRKYPNPDYRFKWLIAIGLVLVITSSIQANILYNQSLWLGIRPQRNWMVYLLLYFPIRKLMFIKGILFKDLKKLICFIGTIELLLYLAQYVFGDSLQFLIVNKHAGGTIVYDTDRYYFNNIFLCLVLFLMLNDLFNKQRILRDLLYILAILIVISVVGKMRMTFVAVCVAIGIGFLLWKKGGILKVLAIVPISIGAIIFSRIEIVQSLISILSGETVATTLEVREVGRAFYLSELTQHPWLGGGYVNTQWRPAALASKVEEGILWVDNGIFGFTYLYGGTGLVWIVVWFVKMYKLANIVRKKIGDYTYFIMPIYWIVACISEAHWYFCSFLVMTLLVCMLEERYDMTIN